jgi:hypothetical protein
MKKLIPLAGILSVIFYFLHVILGEAFYEGYAPLVIIGAMLINLLPKEYFGIAERINVYSIVIFTGVMAIWKYKRVKAAVMAMENC